MKEGMEMYGWEEGEMDPNITFTNAATIAIVFALILPAPPLLL